MTRIAAPSDIIEFWLGIGEKGWFLTDPEVDRDVAARFRHTLDAAATGELDGWLDEPQHALALVITLDQFPRNMFRGSARSFAFDAMALRAGNAALAAGHDDAIEMPLKQFLYLPFMHSERVEDQKRCIELNEAIGNESGAKFGRIHLEAIEQFGRFPHRNQVLGRVTTPAEARYLAAGGFSA